MDITQNNTNASQLSFGLTEADESEGELSGPLIIDEEKPMKAPTPKRKLIDSVIIDEFFFEFTHNKHFSLFVLEKTIKN